MAGYDPVAEAEDLKVQNMNQEDFERIKKVMPLLDAESNHLIELCLKYGFQYKPISEAMGMSITETSNKIKKAIGHIKTIIDQGEKLERPIVKMKVQGFMTKQQGEVLKLRCEEKCSFDTIATTLNLSQKEVHSEFIAAYKLSQAEHQQQTQSA
ncbi:MAG: hypothetical protein ACTIJ9_01500 [Aequorivita sp.]